MNDIQPCFNRFEWRDQNWGARRVADRVAPGVDAAAILSKASSAGINATFLQNDILIR
jgi:hypothetical protein